ncbi:TetR/AcrR family transcriptional regulator [Steroidobacter agaridevorans]|uniref:TetR/AcrR family transcriptional regulator n=1 Tax=Steroidobacter agaridevorans TaxID=2695856 RepID=UPI00137B1A39|nr:TetR/AcrR family transcriptional regulator [Steroidobacter agaridevorans]
MRAPRSLKAAANRVASSDSPLSRRKKPSQERSRTTVQSIFAATEELVREHGFGNVGTRQIAERAGVSIGSLYQYFPTYEAILLAWYEDVAATAAQKMRVTTVDILDKPQIEAVRIAITALLTILERNSLVLLRMPTEAPEIERVVGATSFLTMNRAAMRLFFAQHHEFDPLETERHIFFLETLLMSVFRRWVLEKPRNVPRAMLIEQVVGVVDDYLKRNVVAPKRKR